VKSDNSFQIRLRNAEGVPILDLGGNITKTALKAVKFTLEHLATAGHYNVVLNIEKAQSANWRFLMGLAGVVKKIQQHYGTVDLVATQDRVQQALQS